jgi:CheY-like chemotaxis protein
MTAQPQPPVATEGRILVVDDADASRYLTASWLRRYGYHVTEATTGGQALDLVNELPVDLVLLDVNLPDMSGFEVCARIKGDERTAALPVIHISATAIEVEDKEEGLVRGADAYLVEPVDPRELAATVEAALRYYRARAMAERLARRLTQLNEITLEINTAPSFDDLLAAAAVGTSAMFGAPATVMTETPFGTVRAASTRSADRPVTLRQDNAATLEALQRAVLGEGHGPAVVTIDGSTTVFMSFSKPSLKPICISVSALATDEDRHILLQLGQMTALACENLRSLSEEHTLALILQRSLLPNRLPEVPAMSMAARYLPASRNAEIGGDFYEVADLDGRLLVAIGDVVGHSIEAATVMGEVRHALRAYAVEGHGPVEILDRLDVMIRRFHPEGLTTMCLMLVDVTTGAAEVANAGHIPPLVADADGTRYLDARGSMLGLGLSRPEPVSLTIPRGALVLLVTDGLLEHRRRPVDDGMDALLGMVGQHDELEPLCDRLLDELGEEIEDDIAMLAFRRL